MKKKIEQLILNEEYERAWKKISNYEHFCPYDSDINNYKFLCMDGMGDCQSALLYAKTALEHQPYVADAHYNCGYAYYASGKYFEAYEQYAVAKQMILGGNTASVTVEELDQGIQQILNTVLNRINFGCEDNIQIDKEWMDYIASEERLDWEVRYAIFHSEANMILQEYRDYPDLKKMFLGITGMQSAWHVMCGKLQTNTLKEETEIQRIFGEGNYAELELEQECFVPIIMNSDANLNMQIGQVNVSVQYSSPFQYVNYRLPKGRTVIESEEYPFRLGEAVPILHSKDRKPIVLNIFVDGLSQTVLSDGLEELMPYTYRFFKNGMICTNAYTTGDWTFPSIASIVTGQTLAKHKMLHSKLLRKINADTPILYEYFKNAGYNTTKIGGNWRIAPNYGYARGMNRVHYQHMYEGFPIEKVVSEVIEQMQAMRETDQFIWMEIGELHLISDECNMALLQSQFMAWENSISQGKINSVKQEYDETKKKYYLKQIQYVDRKLAELYQYIEDHYNEDEIVVSLFSDHGQGFLVRPEDEFLCDERTNIAFMTRGSGVHGVSDEFISACDYTPIMCKLAGIDYNYNNTDASLPKTYGGNVEREFVITESIHVGDPYQIILKGKDFSFYLKGKENVTSECRVPLDEYEVKLFDREGNLFQDEEKKLYYTEWCLKHIGYCRIF